MFGMEGGMNNRGIEIRTYNIPQKWSSIVI